MALDLYYYQASPPSWAVLLIAKALDIHLNMKHVDLMKGENLMPDFLQMNPAHKVPVLSDDDFILSESRAIGGYLVDQYAKDDMMYPKDPKRRAKVNQMLYYDIGTLYDRLGDYFFSIYKEQRRDMNKLSSVDEALRIFDALMKDQNWVAGEDVTIADYFMAVSTTTAEIAGMDISKYSNISKWFESAKKAILGYEEYKNNGAKIFKEHYDKAVEKLK